VEQTKNSVASAEIRLCLVLRILAPSPCGRESPFSSANLQKINFYPFLNPKSPNSARRNMRILIAVLCPFLYVCQNGCPEFFNISGLVIFNFLCENTRHSMIIQDKKLFSQLQGEGKL
jgi:hypothetical protein